MKKQLLSVVACLSVSAAFAQTPAADWATNQNAVFPTTLPNTGVKFMDAVDANVVWVTGIDYAAPNRNYCWYSRSTNGGSTFTGGPIYGNDTTTFLLANMEALDANTAWVSAYRRSGPGGGTGGGAIHRTTNGGATWTNMTAAGMFTNTASFANWVTFLTPSVGIANGDPVNGNYEMWRTTDGGNTWNAIPSANIPTPLPGEFAIVNLYAKVGSNNLWFGTNGNRIFRSTDGGLTYNVSSLGAVTSTVTEIAFSSPLKGICFMVNSAFAVELWNTTDGGQIWNQVNPLPANLGLADIVPIPGTGNIASFGIGASNEIISYSSDNGATWTDWGSTGIPYATGDFVNGTTAWAGSIDLNGLTDVWKYTGAGVTGTMSPAAAFAIDPTICFGAPSVVVTPTNNSLGSPGMTYTWSVSSGASVSNPNATAPAITFNSANAYTITLVAQNSVGTHTTSFVVNVTACSAPVANITAPTTGCSNFAFGTGNTTTGAPNPGYLWTISPSNNVTITPSPAVANPSFQVLNAGTYTLTMVASNAGGSVQSTKVVTISPCPPLANINFTFGCNANHTFTTVTSYTNPVGGSMTYTWNVTPPSGAPSGTFTGGATSANARITLGTSASGQYTVVLRVRNASGTATITQVIDRMMYECDAVGLNETTLAENLSIYPNPAHEQLNISLPASNSDFRLKMVNVLGSVVFEEKVVKNAASVSINLAGKPKGVYFMTVESGSEKVTKKIVIE